MVQNPWNLEFSRNCPHISLAICLGLGSPWSKLRGKDLNVRGSSGWLPEEAGDREWAQGAKPAGVPH